jgi:hypothetical protein
MLISFAEFAYQPALLQFALFSGQFQAKVNLASSF